MTTLAQVKINGEYDAIESGAPGVNDDASNGYAVGDRWLNLTTGLSYECSDATTGAAVWGQIEKALDAKINQVLTQTYNRIVRECFVTFMRQRQVALEQAPATITRTSLWYLNTYVSIFAEWTISGASFSVDDEDDLTGSLEDFEYEDEVYLFGSKRNDGVKSIESVDALGLTFGTAGVGTGDYALIVLVDIPTDFDQTVGRMIYYDVVHRQERAGLQSEKIGTYSYTMGDVMIAGLRYPADVAAGIDSYLNAAPIADVDYTP